MIYPTPYGICLTSIPRSKKKVLRENMNAGIEYWIMQSKERGTAGHASSLIRMRGVPCLLHVLFSLGGTTPEPIHSTRASPTPFTFATCVHHVPAISSLSLLAKKKSSSQEDSSKEDTVMNTWNWQWLLQERFQMTDNELSKNMVRMHPPF